jgi:uncharacterized membrane protein YeaQ/YmgE (transglycosylase-associated protein family)
MDNRILIAAIIGLLVAALIYYSVPGRICGGIALTLVVGVVAAVVMTLLGRQVGFAGIGTVAAYFVAVIGTALVTVVWRAAMGRE